MSDQGEDEIQEHPAAERGMVIERMRENGGTTLVFDWKSSRGMNTSAAD